MKRICSIIILLFIILINFIAFAGGVSSSFYVTDADGSPKIWNPTGFNFSGTDSVTEGSNHSVNISLTAGTGLTDAYSYMSDGTNTSTAASGDTFRLRAANSLLSIVVTDNDATYGDNVLFTVEPNLSNYTNDAGFLTAESDPIFSAMDTEAELESQLTDVTNVYTNNDGNLTDDDLSDNTTDDLAEGTSNLYWTQARFDTAFSGKTTDDLNEGATNKYATLINIQNACSNDFHNIGGIDDDVPDSGDLGIIDTEAEFESELFSVLTPSEALLLDQTSPQTISNGVPLLDTTPTGSADIKSLVNKEYVDLAVTSLGAVYYMYDDDDATGYKTCHLDPSSDAETYIEKTSLVDDDYIGGWISATGEAPAKLLKGVYNWYVTLEKTTGTQDLRVYWELVERKTDNSETVIATSSNSNLISIKGAYLVPLQLNDDYLPDSGSRIVGKLYADVSGGGSAPTVRLYYQGNTSSRWEIPANSEVFKDIFVPYDGAVKDVDLGSYNLTTTGTIDGGAVKVNGTDVLTSESDPVFGAMDTEAELETQLTDVTNVYTNNDGNLTDDDLSNNSINDLNDVDTTGWAENKLLKFDASGNLIVGTDNVDDADADATNELQNIFQTMSDGTNTATADSTTDTFTFEAGTGISVTVDGTNDKVTITNTGDTDASDDLTTSTSFSGDVSGTYNNLQLGSGVVTTTEISDGTITHTDVSSSDSLRKCALHFTIDGGGSAITTGGKAWVRVPYNMTITGWDITADQSGDIVIDVYKDTYANFPPDSSDSITGTEKPTLSSATKNQDTSLSSWTTSVSAGDYIKINVDSASTVTKVYLTIYGYKN